MIFSGPPGPKLTAEALVASEKVGEGGPGVELRLVIPKANSRSERDLLEGIVTQVMGKDNEDPYGCVSVPAPHIYYITIYVYYCTLT